MHLPVYLNIQGFLSSILVAVVLSEVSMHCFDSAVVAVDEIPLNSFGPLYAENTFLYEQCTITFRCRWVANRFF